jgi:hypothetical protein
MVADRSRGRLGEVELRRDLWCLVLDMYGRRGNGTHAVAIVPEQHIESNREALVFDSRHTVFAYRRPISSDRLSQAASTRIQPRLLEAWLILYRPGKRGRVGDIYFCEMAVRGYMSIYVLRSTNGGEEDAIMGRTCRIKQASYLWYGYPIWWQAGLFFCHRPPPP